MVTKEYMKAFAEKYYANEENRKRHNEWQRRYNRRPENRKRMYKNKNIRLTKRRYEETKNRENVIAYNDETFVVTKKCNICGKEFERDCKLKHGWRKDQCSRYCYLANRNTKLGIPINHEVTHEGNKQITWAKCKYNPCSKMFKIILSQHKGRRKYCSSKCSSLNQRVIRKQHNANQKE